MPHGLYVAFYRLTNLKYQLPTSGDEDSLPYTAAVMLEFML